MDITKLCLGCMEEKDNTEICSYCGYEEGSAPESALHLPPGTVLESKNIIGRALGQGGFGITYLAYDQKLNLKLAIKEYLPQELVYRIPGNTEVSIYKQTLAQHFSYGLNKYLEEARTLARFAGHPGIVTVRDYFEANGTAYIVMEYIEGVTLKEYLEKKGDPVPIQQALNIFMPVLDALKEVHGAGILHRDISPDNLLIDARGRVVLIDFGAARQAVGEQSRSLSVIMKAGYSPPEQYQTRGKQGPWTDVYAVAATIYRSITGEVPLDALDRMAEDTLSPPSQLGMEIENYMEHALLKAMAVSAKERYQTVEEFQAALIGFRAIATDGIVEFDIQENKTNENKETVIEETQPSMGDSQLANGDISVKENSGYGEKWIKLILGLFIIVIIISVVMSVFNSGNNRESASEIFSYGTIHYAGGTYTGDLLNNKPHGNGIWTHLDGREYTGEWKYGKVHGQGILTYGIDSNLPGAQYTGAFKDNKPHGFGTYIYKDIVKTGIWENGELVNQE